MVVLEMTTDDTPNTTREPATIRNLDIAGGQIDITITEDGTVTATARGNPNEQRAFAAITGKDPNRHWADLAATGLTEAFTTIPLTADEGLAVVVAVALTADKGIGTRASNSNGRAPIVCLHHPEPSERHAACGEFGWPWTPIAAHHAANSDDPVLVDRLVGQHPNEAAPLAATNPHEAARSAAAKRCGAAHLDLFVTDPNPKIRAAAASNTATCGDHLRALAVDDDKTVVSAVRVRPDAATEDAADLLFGAGTGTLSDKIAEARKYSLREIGDGFVDHDDRRWMFASTSTASDVFHLVAADPDGRVARHEMPPMHASYVSKGSMADLPGTWANLSACGREWELAVPNDRRGVRSACRSCLKRAVSGD